MAGGWAGDVAIDWELLRRRKKRARIILLPNEATYDAFTGRMAWSSGRADVVRREIVTYVGMRSFFDALLVHEIGHIVFREFVGYAKKLPLWLDEGVATCLETRLKDRRMNVVQGALGGEPFMPLARLSEVTSAVRVEPAVFYAEAGSVVEFLLSRGGRVKFAEFCSDLRRMPDDGDWFRAAGRVYGFKDLGEMDEAWQRHLRTLTTPGR